MRPFNYHIKRPRVKQRVYYNDTPPKYNFIRLHLLYGPHTLKHIKRLLHRFSFFSKSTCKSEEDPIQKCMRSKLDLIFSFCMFL